MGLAETFGRNVRDTRRARGLTLEQLAHDLDMSYSYVGQLERGQRNASLGTVERIAVALSCDPLALLSTAQTALKTHAK